MKAFPYSVYEFKLLPNNKLNYLGKPAKVQRYADGKWIEDDGEWDLAFAVSSECMAYHIFMPWKTNLGWQWDGGNCTRREPRHPNFNAWHYELTSGSKFRDWPSWDGEFCRDKHPNELAGKVAMDYVCSLRSCSNGRGPDLFHIDDPYIKAGLVRVKETKEILKFPKTMKCIYCGEIPTFTPKESKEAQ